ncbi:MAG: penicillin-binding protein activator [Rhodospirillales bacterium]
MTDLGFQKMKGRWMHGAGFHALNCCSHRSRTSGFFVAACFAAIGVLVSGCESSEIPGWKQLNSALTTEPSPKALPVTTTNQAFNSTVAVVTAPQPSPPQSPPVIVPRPSSAQPAFQAPLFTQPRSPSQPAPNVQEENALPSFIPLLTRSTGTINEGQPFQNYAPPPPPPAEGAVRVALLLPLSGPNSPVGQAMLNAAQLAVFAFAGDAFELLPQDTKGTPKGAVEAAALAIGDGAELILGPLLSASVKAISPHARAAGVPVLGFSSDRTVAGDGTYTMGFLPSAEVHRIIAYAHSKGHQRFAALVPDNSYGSAIVSALEAATNRLGVVVTRVKYYDPQAEDYTAVVRQLANYRARRAALVFQRKELENRSDDIAKRALKRLERLQTIGELPFDALLVPAGGKKLQAIAALLPFFDIDPAKIKMLGTGQWGAKGVGAEPALIGGWYAAPPPAARINFIRQYKELYGKNPHRLATLAYDASALAAVLSRAKEGPNFSGAAITTSSGFAGRDGIFRFLPDGVAERGLAVLQLTPRGSRVIDTAPASFGPPVN